MQLSRYAVLRPYVILQLAVGVLSEVASAFLKLETSGSNIVMLT